jgi:hypothetical protein
MCSANQSTIGLRPTTPTRSGRTTVNHQQPPDGLGEGNHLHTDPPCNTLNGRVVVSLCGCSLDGLPPILGTPPRDFFLRGRQSLVLEIDPAGVLKVVNSLFNAFRTQHKSPSG